MVLTDDRNGREQLKTDWSPEMVQYWHPKRNGALTPDEVLLGSNRHLWWRCERGHEWQARAFSVKGCPYCAGKLAIPGENDLATLWPDILADWDYEKNTISPTQVLPSAHDKVWWKCGLGHSWQAMVFSRTREKRAGCPYCTGRKVLAGFNDLATLQPQIAAQWHPELNGDCKPGEVTLGSNRKVWWQCADGHVWQAAIYSRTRKNSAGCPLCSGRGRKKKIS